MYQGAIPARRPIVVFVVAEDMRFRLTASLVMTATRSFDMAEFGIPMIRAKFQRTAGPTPRNTILTRTRTRLIANSPFGDDAQENAVSERSFSGSGIVGGTSVLVQCTLRDVVSEAEVVGATSALSYTSQARLRDLNGSWWESITLHEGDPIPLLYPVVFVSRVLAELLHGRLEFVGPCH